MKKMLKKPAMKVVANVQAYDSEIVNQTGCAQNTKNCLC